MKRAYDRSMPRSHYFPAAWGASRLVNPASQGPRERPRRRAAAWLFAAIGGLSAAGCSAVGSTPRRTLGALLTAARSNDAARSLHALLPESAQRAEPLEAFRARIGADPRSLDELRAEVQAALDAGAPVTVEVRRGSRRALAVDERDGWRVGGPPLGDLTTVATPGRAGARAALEHLRRALTRGDLEGLLAMLSARARGAMLTDLRDLADALDDPDALQFPEVPGATRVRLPDGRVLLLVWEADGWHVDGLREGAAP